MSPTSNTTKQNNSPLGLRYSVRFLRDCPLQGAVPDGAFLTRLLMASNVVFSIFRNLAACQLDSRAMYRLHMTLQIPLLPKGLTGWTASDSASEDRMGLFGMRIPSCFSQEIALADRTDVSDLTINQYRTRDRRPREGARTARA